MYNVEDDEALLKIYTNQTGHFPKKSCLGNQYVMVLVELNSSEILDKAMKNCTSGKMIRAVPGQLALPTLSGLKRLRKKEWYEVDN